jgi:O-6-methylguanine DNA methyltransferase
MRQAPGDLWTDRVPSPLGTMLVVWDAEARLRALDFADFEQRMVGLLRRHYGAPGDRLRPERVPRALARPIEAFFAGEVDAVGAIPVATGGSDFQRSVWAALRAIPTGTTTTYGRLASSLGRPSASRAVGAANGANPIAIVVPCHRVVGADRSLTGYAGGLERKRWLLAHERRHARSEHGHF